MTSRPTGPLPYSHAERRARTLDIAARLRQRYGSDLLALGLYGSHGRGDDGPFSDIEIHCILQGEEIDHVYEWSEGPWKAEVDVYSQDVFLAAAAELDEFWPITHGAYTRVVSLHGPEDIFRHAERVVFDHSDEDFNSLMREVLIGDLYEVIGKARNALALSRPFSLAGEVVDAARYSACLLGLAHRKLFTSAPNALNEALRLPERPEGFDSFARLALDGDLRDNRAVMEALDGLWAGMENWARKRGLRLHRPFDELLSGQD